VADAVRAMPDMELVGGAGPRSGEGKSNMKSQTTALQVGGLQGASSSAVLERALLRRSGVLAVSGNAVSQTAGVTYDPDRTDVAELSGWVRDCGSHGGGQSVPEHVCAGQPPAVLLCIYPGGVYGSRWG